MSNPATALRQFYEAALDSLHALVRLHDFVLRCYQLTCEQRNVLNADSVGQEYLVPLIQGLAQIADKSEHGSSFERMIAARLALGRPSPHVPKHDGGHRP